MPFNPAGPDEDLKTAAGYAIGQNIYTPDHIEISSLIPEIVPYAGWLYAGVYLQRATESVFDHFEIDLGVIGPSSLAEDVQREVHEAFDQIIPRGWDNQLGDEFGIDFMVQRKWKVPLVTTNGANAVELIPQAGLTLGTVHRHANAGLLLRIGMNLPDDFGPGRIEEPAAATGKPPYVRAVLFCPCRRPLGWQNTLLEGNNHRSSHGVDPESLLAKCRSASCLVWSRARSAIRRRFNHANSRVSRTKIVLVV